MNPDKQIGEEYIVNPKEIERKPKNGMFALHSGEESKEVSDFFFKKTLEVQKNKKPKV